MNTWKLKEDGDDLERKYSNEIVTKVYSYELIWSRFIGNDGLNHMDTLVNFPPEKNDFRKRFSEHNYTIIQSILCLRVVKDEVFKIQKSEEDFMLKMQNHILSFYAHMGRIYDNLLSLIYYFGRITEKLTKDLSLDEITHDQKFIRPFVQELEEFYYQRHIVLHGKQVPIGHDQIGNIIFPKLRTEKNSPKGYDKSMTWPEAIDSIPLNENLEEIDTNLPICVNKILYTLFNELNKYLSEHKISIVPPLSIKKNLYLNAIDVYNFQGGRGPSSTSEGRLGYSGSIENDKK